MSLGFWSYQTVQLVLYARQEVALKTGCSVDQKNAAADALTVQLKTRLEASFASDPDFEEVNNIS